MRRIHNGFQRRIIPKFGAMQQLLKASMLRNIFRSMFIFILLPVMAYAQPTVSPENVIIYKEKNRFAGWPANNGHWSWGDEIVVGFPFKISNADMKIAANIRIFPMKPV